MPAARKRNLVVCRIEKGSLHREWIGDPATRSYDVWLDHWGEEGDWQGEPALVSIGRNTTKWPRLAALFRERADRMGGYAAVWLPDDDVRIDAAGVESMFDWVHRLGLWIAQPALTVDSYCQHRVTLENRSFAVRYTNFVEVMAPVFSAHALERCREGFAESTSGWGLDAVWSRMLGDPPDRIGIIDAVRMTHTRPLGGGSLYRALSVDPRKELEELLRRHGIPALTRRYRGGLLAGSPGERVEPGARFLWHLLRGAPPGERWRKSYWASQLEALGWRAA
jgi:hypothetical protein